MKTNIPQNWSKFLLKDVTFVNLMMRRIYNVLIVANPYDAFMLEDDGRVEEKIYNEYMELRNAVEELGGDFDLTEDFDDDPLYRFLKGLDEVEEDSRRSPFEDYFNPPKQDDEEG